MISLTSNNKEYKILLRFLKEHNVYISYFTEMRKNYDRFSSFYAIYHRDYIEFFNKCSPSNWLDHCFTWHSTAKGENFWSHLNELWRNKLIYEV
jgi:hypothetical protein